MALPCGRGSGTWGARGEALSLSWTPPETIFPLAHWALPFLPLPTLLFPHPILSSPQTLC